MKDSNTQALETPVLIIGAGPAGLAVAAHLRQLGIPFTLLEASQQVGHSWIQHYERLHLHTVKALSHLPFLPFPEHYPQYVPRQHFVEYLQQYAQHFQIAPLFGQAVVQLQRATSGQWHLETSTGDTFLAREVVVATGVNRIPYLPTFEGAAQFRGIIRHTREYVNGQPYSGQKVLVVGMGNTGAEIALDLYEQGAQPWISVRGPVNIVPRDFLGQPTQRTALKLAKLPAWLGDRIGILLRRIATGDLSPYGIDTPKVPPAAQLRRTGQTPVVDVGTVAAIKAGHIRVLPAIRCLYPEGVEFVNGQRHAFDAILLATGYQPGLPAFIAGCEDFLDAQQLPLSCIGTGTYRGLYFIGFDNYTAGGILGVINRDAAKIAEVLKKLHPHRP